VVNGLRVHEKGGEKRLWITESIFIPKEKKHGGNVKNKHYYRKRGAREKRTSGYAAIQNDKEKIVQRDRRKGRGV